MSDLIARLRVCEKYDPDQKEAADALEAQARRIAELEAALRPFADHAGKINHELISAKTVFEARKGHTLYYTCDKLTK